MPSSCSAFGQARDLLGKQVSFMYKGSGKYGTAVGGYVSMSARIIVWTLALLELYACFFNPASSETS